jgi:hypothetical protein
MARSRLTLERLPMQRLLAPAARAWRDGGWARHRRLRARARRPLLSMHDLYPQARLARRHELGLMTVALDDIHGTAVEGRPQRGGDFRPLRPMRTRNWKARWLSLRLAVDALLVLPPVVLDRVGGAYWVVDGHNRVAMGLDVGQVAIDAVVTRLSWDGAPPDSDTVSRGSLAAMLAGSDALRAAGQGRLSTTVAGLQPNPEARGRHGVGL